MIWLTWRQARTQTVVMAAILAVFGLVLAITGPHLVTLYRASTFAACQQQLQQRRRQLPQPAGRPPCPTT